jgi:hypothetical protein
MNYKEALQRGLATQRKEVEEKKEVICIKKVEPTFHTCDNCGVVLDNGFRSYTYKGRTWYACFSDECLGSIDLVLGEGTSVMIL